MKGVYSLASTTVAPVLDPGSTGKISIAGGK